MPQFQTVLGKKYAGICVANLRFNANKLRNPSEGQPDEALAAYGDTLADFIEGKLVTDPVLLRACAREVPQMLRRAAEELERTEKPGPDNHEGWAELRANAMAIQETYGDRKS